MEDRSACRRTLADVRVALAEVMKSVASDCTFGMLPESTISIPSIVAGEIKETEATEVKQSATTGASTRAAKAVLGRKPLKAKTTKKPSGPGSELGMRLSSIRDKLFELQPLASRVSSVSEYSELCSLLTSVSVFVSAATQQSGQIHVHPSSAALLIGKRIRSSCKSGYYIDFI